MSEGVMGLSSIFETVSTQLHSATADGTSHTHILSIMSYRSLSLGMSATKGITDETSRQRVWSAGSTKRRQVSAKAKTSRFIDHWQAKSLMVWST